MRVIGIDVGGTGTRLGAVSLKNGSVNHFETFPAISNRKKFLDELCARIVNISRKEKIAGIGLGMPGPIDVFKGKILNPPNVRALWDFPIVSYIQKELRVPVRLANDADAFTWGEAVFGAGKGKKNILGITLGTGTGAGLVINGKLYQGSSGSAAEIGRNEYGDDIFDHVGSIGGLMRLYGKDISPLALGEAADRGNRRAKRAWRMYGERLAQGVATAVNIVDPELIILGGGLSGASRHFLGPFQAELRRLILPQASEVLRVRTAKLGFRAGLIGAAALFLRRLD